jgi:hypothetical protein
MRGGSTHHTIHKIDKAPKGHGIILHDSIDGSEEITHALDITQVFVIFVISQ